MWASNARKLTQRPENGQAVVVTARMAYWKPGGSLQLEVRAIRQAGVGQLELELRQRLEVIRERGWTDLAHKKVLPLVPKGIAIITSRKAAALQDVIDTAARRWPAAQLYLVDVLVQGPAAAGQIAAAINQLSDNGDQLGIDVVILTRGGGSIEDLWAFNEMPVAEAVFHCQLPIVAAIGHETDTTLAELVADMRCATPTQAAMEVVPDRVSLLEQVGSSLKRLRFASESWLHHARVKLDALAGHPVLAKPEAVIEPARERVSSLEGRLQRAAASQVRQVKAAFEPKQGQLEKVTIAWIASEIRQLSYLSSRLQAADPKQVLARGFSFTTDSDGRVIDSASAVSAGQILVSHFKDGKVRSHVQGEAPKSAKVKPVKKAAKKRKPKVDDGPGLFE